MKEDLAGWLVITRGPWDEDATKENIQAGMMKRGPSIRCTGAFAVTRETAAP